MQVESIIRMNTKILTIYSIDVGGSAELDTEQASLANITLRWMLHEIQSIDYDVIFDNAALDRMKIPTDCVRRVPRPNMRSRDDPSQETTSATQIMSWEQMEDIDIRAATHDELTIHPWWWLLQIPTLNERR
jgi:hypothetical protein